MRKGSDTADYSMLRERGRIVVMDFEGTGNGFPRPSTVLSDPGVPTPGAIVEIGAVELRLVDGEWCREESFHTLVQPDAPINPFAQRIHGIGPRELIDAPRFVDVVDAFVSFVGDAALAAHAFHNERHVLNYEMARAGAVPWGEEAYPTSRWFCTQTAFKRACPQRRSSLDAVCDRLGIPRQARQGRHGALLDAELASLALMALYGIRDMPPPASQAIPGYPHEEPTF